MWILTSCASRVGQSGNVTHHIRLSSNTRPGLANQPPLPILPFIICEPRSIPCQFPAHNSCLTIRIRDRLETALEEVQCVRQRQRQRHSSVSEQLSNEFSRSPCFACSCEHRRRKPVLVVRPSPKHECRRTPTYLLDATNPGQLRRWIEFKKANNAWQRANFDVA